MRDTSFSKGMQGDSGSALTGATWSRPKPSSSHAISPTLHDLIHNLPALQFGAQSPMPHSNTATLSFTVAEPAQRASMVPQATSCRAAEGQHTSVEDRLSRQSNQNLVMIPLHWMARIVGVWLTSNAPRRAQRRPCGLTEASV